MSGAKALATPKSQLSPFCLASNSQLRDDLRRLESRIVRKTKNKV
jgi:hypothetical protein